MARKDTILCVVQRTEGDEGLRALLTRTFAQCAFATLACDMLGMSRNSSTGRGRVSDLRRIARRVGAHWPYSVARANALLAQRQAARREVSR